LSRTKREDSNSARKRHPGLLRVLRVFAVSVPLAAACGGRGASQPRPATALERAYPVLRWVPAGASYALVAGRSSEGALALRELAELVSIAYGVTTAELDAGLRSALGVSPLDAAELGEAGIDLAGSAALFGQAGFPTAIVPVADPDRLRRVLDRERPQEAASVTQHRGHEVYAWNDGARELSWVALDRWLVVHLRRRGGGADLDWLDRVLDAPDGANLGADPDLSAAALRGSRALAGDGEAGDGEAGPEVDGVGEVDRQRGPSGGPAGRPLALPPGGLGGGPGLVGMVRFADLARDLDAWAPAGVAACTRRGAGAVPRLLFAAGFSWQGGDVWAALDLTPAAARALAAHTAEPAPPGYYDYRSGAALAADWSVELGWLERARSALSCPFLDRRIADPVRAATGFAGPRGWHLAASAIDLDRFSGEGAVHLVLSDPALVEAQLESIPGRSLFERTRSVAGVPVRVLSVPGLPSIMYRLHGKRFTLTIGDRIMRQVLATDADGADADGELARFAIRPRRLPDLAGLIGTGLAALAGDPARPAGRVIAERLSRYEEAAMWARRDGDSVALFARMRLRRTGRKPAPQVRRAALW
jgi:hypothetical protein